MSSRHKLPYDRVESRDKGVVHTSCRLVPPCHRETRDGEAIGEGLDMREEEQTESAWGEVDEEAQYAV